MKGDSLVHLARRMPERLSKGVMNTMSFLYPEALHTTDSEEAERHEIPYMAVHHVIYNRCATGVSVGPYHWYMHLMYV